MFLRRVVAEVLLPGEVEDEEGEESEACAESEEDGGGESGNEVDSEVNEVTGEERARVRERERIIEAFALFLGSMGLWAVMDACLAYAGPFAVERMLSEWLQRLARPEELEEPEAMQWKRKCEALEVEVARLQKENDQLQRGADQLENEKLELAAECAAVKNKLVAANLRNEQMLEINKTQAAEVEMVQRRCAKESREAEKKLKRALELEAHVESQVALRVDTALAVEEEGGEEPPASRMRLL